MEQLTIDTHAICTKCGKILPHSEFYARPERHNNRKSQCKSCVKKAARQYRKTHPKHHKYIHKIKQESKRWHKESSGTWKYINHTEKDWARQINRFYNITAEEYNSRFLKQDGICAICGKKTAYRLCIDHDHKCCPSKKSCGKCIRGLLCKKCNFVIGNADEDSNILYKAIDYLNRYSNVPEIQ